MSDGVPVQRLLRERVAEEVRALLARRRMTGAELAAAIGKSPMYVSRRVRGEVAFDLDDMERLADVLEVELSDLLPKTARSAGGGGQPNGGLASLDFSRPPADRSAQPRRARLIGDHPIGRPGTPPSEGRRRPRSSRPVNRPMAA